MLSEPPPPPAPPDPDRSGRRRSRARAVAVAGLIVLGGGAVAIVSLGSDRRTETDRPVPSLAQGPAPEQSYDTEVGMAPLPRARPNLVQPVAGETTEAPGVALASAPAEPVKDPKITGPASDSGRSDVLVDPGVRGLEATTATALPNGIALPPLEAPQAVLDVIQAGNIIARSPYKWGGGHGNFQDSGYDCSGSVTYALYYAGLIGRSATSGELMGYGKPGPGKWISIYTNPGHVYMIVAGVRFDTVARKLTGSRWQNSPGSAPGRYEVRHPPGL